MVFQRKRIQQFHKSHNAARDYIKKSLADPKSDLARDFPGFKVGIIIPASPKQRVGGRKLFDIQLLKD